MTNIIPLAGLLAASLAAEVPSINNTFFFEETGASAQTGRGFQAVGLLKLDGQGRVSGTEYVKDMAAIGSRQVTGMYQFDADGVGMMSLQFPITDDDGNPQSGTANYRLAYAADGRITVLRIDNGFLAEGELSPSPAATAAMLKGSFVVKEESVDNSRQSMLSQGTWKFDGDGGVEARLLAKSFYQSTVLALAGRLEAQADGTYNLKLTAPVATADDGTVLEPVAMSYKLVPGAKTFDLLRLDPGVASQIEVLAK